jgi:hypothetical protein
MKYFQLFKVSAGANTIKYDDGLKSTETEKKKLITCHVQLEKYAANEDCDVQGWHERAKIFEFPQQYFSTELASATARTAAGELFIEIPVDMEIPVGEVFKVAIKCESTAVDMRGVYEYEIIS